MRERFIRSAQTLLTVVGVLALVAVSTPQLATAGDIGAVVDLVLLPSNQTVDVDDIFDVTIQAQCNGQDISTIAAFIDFDPAYLEVQSVTPGPTLPTVVQNTYNNTAGTIDYSAGKLGEPFPSGTFTVATISFKALDSTASISISFSTVFPRVTEADFGGTSKLDELFGATVTIEGVDTTAPYTSGHNPAKDATDVPIDTNIVVHVLDDGAGVDQATILMRVEGTVVTPVITGTSSDYTLTYDPPVDFGYLQVVDVTVDADDLAVNSMATDSYSFTTQEEDIGAVVDLVLLPSNQTVDVDDIFDVTIQAQCNGQDISTIAAFIDFDPAYLEVQSVTPGPTLPTVVQNTYNNTAGTIDYSAGKLGEPFPSGTFTVATISFKALDSTASISISFSTVFPRVTEADFGGTSKLDELFGATVTIEGVDTTAPYTSGHNPAKDATDVPIDTNIVVHVLDDGAGVDQATILMRVEGTVVTPVITGTSSDYTLTYDPPVDFGYLQVVDVTVDADDLAVNSMATDSYSFTTQEEDVGAVVDLVLLPSNQTVDVDDIFDVTIQAQCNGQDISTIAAFIDFDPAYLEVQSVTPGPTLPTVVQNTYNNTAGTIDYSAGKLGEPFPSGTFTVATISFKALDSTASTSVSFSTVFPRVTEADFGGTSKLDELFGATVTIEGVDTTAPYTSGHNPAKDATDVPIDTNIVVHVLDDGAGVDQATILMRVEGTVVTPVITGTSSDYTLTYDPPVDFGYLQVVDVTVDADDLAVNSMATDSYSFTTQEEDVGAVVDLVLLPSNQTVDVDDIFDITIQAQCNGQDISTIAAFIDFDPAYLEVQSVTPGPTLPTVVQNTYNNTAGTIDYSAGKLGEPFPSGTFTVATISFKALDSTASISISFSTVFPRVTEADFGGTSKLDELFGATVTIVGVNTPPVLSSGQVNPDPGYVTTNFTYSVTYTDADNDPPASPTVSIDGGGPIGMTEVNPGDTDYTDGKDYEYTTSGLAKNIAHTYQFAASDGVDNATGDTASHDGPTVQNSLPTAPVVDVTPDSPVTTDDLVCTITTPSTDPDAGDTVTYSYEWYKDSVLQPGLTTNTVASSNTTTGEVWRCVVTPNDGTADGPTDEDAVTILNSPPVANAGADQMALIGTNVTLDGSGSSDADDDPLDYSWTQTGGPAVTLSNPTAVNATFTPAVADTYTFSLVVYDGIDYSLADTTVCTIKASNVAPVLSDGAVSPNSGRTSVTFTYSVAYTDDDNDAPIFITVSIDGGVPQDMNVRSGGDGNYTNSEIYEYTITGTALGIGSHTFRFAASDGIADATGDIDIHAGPTVSSGGGGRGGEGWADTRAPGISGIEWCDCTKTSITIKWKTDEGSTSQVEYWASEHIFSPLGESLVRSHEVKLANLKPCCDYRFRVISEDSAGNVAISEEEDFTTLGTPAAFTISALSISPAEVQAGESITISALVTNSGDATGTYEAVLKIDNAVVATQSVTLAGGTSEEVTFTTSKDVAGTYTVSIDDQSATVVVRAPTTFTISALDISPAKVAVGEDIDISALITNTGNVTGTYEAILKIDNAVIATQNVTLAGGASEEITFTTSKDVVGAYAVDLNGLLGTFVVKAGLNWWLIGGIIAAVVAVLLVLYFYVWRKRGVQKVRGT